MFITKQILFIAFFLFLNFTIQAQNKVVDTTTTHKIVNQLIDINEAIKLKSNEKKQQTMLINFKKDHKNSKRITVEEKNDHYELIVESISKNGFTGGAVGYSLDKITGVTKMIWHEHPMQITEPKYKIKKKSK